MERFKKRILAALVVLAAAALCQTVSATEGGGDNIGQGSEGFFAGMLPAPGW